MNPATGDGAGNTAADDAAKEIARLQRILRRERAARAQAETIAETSTRELWDRQQELVLLEGVSAAANAADGITPALNATLLQVCRHLQWPVGQVWLTEPTGRLRHSGVSHVSDEARFRPFVDTSARYEFTAGHGLPGRVLAGGEPVALTDVTVDDNFPRAGAANSVGLRSAAAFPVLLNGRVVAVIECFTETAVEASPSVLKMLGHVGLQLSRVFERVEIAEQLRHDALHDALTGLPNRTLFADRAARAVAAAERSTSRVAIALIDLDRFKEVNDTLGHQQGDRLLVEIGARLSSTLRKQDTIARLGGDEFGLVLTDAGRDEDVLRTVERIRSALIPPVELDGVMVQVDASVGLAMYPEDGDLIETLQRRADVAMYEAKRRHLGCRLYRPELDLHSPERLGLAAALRQAIDEGGLVLHYQPQVATAADGRTVTGVEALLRWHRPGKGNVPPVEFIPLAERTGLIRPLTSFVLREAITQAKRWHDAGIGVPVAVNIGTRNLLDPHFPTEVEDLLASSGLPPELLELEITESSMLEDPDITLAVLTNLGRLGVSIAIDDFGTGYSSMAQLKQLPVSVLKIDRGFVSAMVADSRDAFIVGSTIQLGHDLGLNVIAEGVEDCETLDHLAALGCDSVQGFLVQRPAPAPEITAWLHERSERLRFTPQLGALDDPDDVLIAG